MVDCIRILLLSLMVFVGISSPLAAELSLPEDIDAQVEQGIAAYDTGNYEAAKTILLPLAENGHPEAMHIIGRLHDGTGVFPSDPNVECDWYERAANKGLAKSMYNMGFCFRGVGRPKNIENERNWLLKAVQINFYPAMINLAALDPSEGKEYRHWMVMAQEYGSAYAKVDLWLQGYKSDSRMNLNDFLCVSWHILLGDKDREYCD